MQQSAGSLPQCPPLSAISGPTQGELARTFEQAKKNMEAPGNAFAARCSLSTSTRRTHARA
jgi:hypothetical protein